MGVRGVTCNVEAQQYSLVRGKVQAPYLAYLVVGGDEPQFFLWFLAGVPVVIVCKSSVLLCCSFLGFLKEQELFCQPPLVFLDYWLLQLCVHVIYMRQKENPENSLPCCSAGPKVPP